MVVFNLYHLRWRRELGVGGWGSVLMCGRDMWMPRHKLTPSKQTISLAEVDQSSRSNEKKLVEVGNQFCEDDIFSTGAAILE